MINFLTIVLLVFGVLQIILFFKIWKMTNDVDVIKRSVENRHAPRELMKANLAGKKECLKEMLLENFADDVSNIAYGDSNASIDNIKNKYKELFAKAEIELPESINKITSVSDVKRFS